MDVNQHTDTLTNGLSLADRRVILVGGAGFIGHHLALRLATLGARVDLVDHLQVNHVAAYAASDVGPDGGDLYRRMLAERLSLLRQAGVHLHVLDARDLHGLASLVRDREPHIVVHLAGIAHANRANVEPHLAFEHTVRTLACTLEAVRGRRPHFIYFSSSMVYGNFASGTVDEDSPCTPLGVYGSLKYGGEKMVIAAGQVSGMPWTIIRPSALYGERCVSRRVVQVFIESALDGRELVVAGNGEDRLDFTYIEDLVHGVVCAIESPAAHDQVFNLTCGCSRSIRELIDLVTEEFDGVTVRFEPRDRLTPSRGTLCVDKARSLIGYAPSATLERGFGQYARWYRSFARRPAGRANAPELLVGS